jgi:hypothetical protein
MIFIQKKDILIKWYKILQQNNFYIDKKEDFEDKWGENNYRLSEFFCFPESNNVKHYLIEVFPNVKAFENL